MNSVVDCGIPNVPEALHEFGIFQIGRPYSLASNPVMLKRCRNEMLSWVFSDSIVAGSYVIREQQQHGLGLTIYHDPRRRSAHHNPRTGAQSAQPVPRVEHQRSRLPPHHRPAAAVHTKPGPATEATPPASPQPERYEGRPAGVVGQ